MEHLNYRQFTSKPLSIHWDRHNYYTIEELKVMWNETYKEAMKELDKTIEENETQ